MPDSPKKILLVNLLEEDPSKPVTWGELRIILIVQAIILALVAMKLLWFNDASFG